MTNSATITIRLPKRTLWSVAELAAQKKLSRDDVLAEIIEEYARRQATRQRIQQNMQRKWESPHWSQSVANIERLRAKAKPTSEAELQADTRTALKAVRAEARRSGGKKR